LSIKTWPGTELGRIATQIAWLGTIAREGALFVVAGRRGAASR